MAQPLSASGTAVAQPLVAPSIISKRAYNLSASGVARSSGGALAINRLLPAGGVTDFGVWNSAQPDTAMSRDLTHAVGSDATASRGWLAATAPTEYRRAGGPVLWNSALYAGAGIKWTSVPTAQKESFHQVQFERGSPVANRLSWDATSWEARRCYTAQGNAQWATVQLSTEAAFSGHQSGKITYLGAPAGSWGYSIIPITPTGMTACSPGETLSGSVSLRMNRAAWWTAGLHFYDANYTQIGNYSYSAYIQHPGGNKWATSSANGIVAPSGAAYVAVVPHISINSTPAATDSIAPVGEVAYCDMHRIWSAPYNITSTPTAYQPPKKLTIDVRAKRVNILNNPGMDSNTNGWGAFGTGNAPFPMSLDTSVGRQRPGSLKFAVGANLGTYTGLGTNVGVATLTSWSPGNVGGFGFKPNTTYTLSVYVKRAPGCPDVFITSKSTHTVVDQVASTALLPSHPELMEGDWARLWLRVRTSADEDGTVSFSVNVATADITSAGAAATFWADDALIEEGDQLLPYFDGNTPGSDYLWAGTAGYSSSHYYPEFRANAYRLSDIVHAAVPHGTQVEIRYAQPLQ